MVKFRWLHLAYKSDNRISKEAETAHVSARRGKITSYWTDRQPSILKEIPDMTDKTHKLQQTKFLLHGYTLDNRIVRTAV